MKDPARTNAIILDAATTFGADFGWTYTQGAADYAAKTIAADKLVANGPDGTVGKFDMDRVTKLIDKAIPVYTAQGSPPKSGVKAEDVVTNKFIQDGIGL